ncbi:ATP synthase, H+ transporting, mitochondrial F0 complex-like protein [Oopsacas minuta]|uniref:ATP synthase subunit d, mitochondrial n=1 Tax=Oopsacas minuta TaxID=111878 RepID=A0AAV7KMD2_9METZ|nr:ATP synthase, H+ transporting, mitochondrial F0 complex-like protein [Oopsacas minuta]
MASKTVGKRVFDWSRILSRVPKEARGDYMSLRAKYESLQTQNTNYTERPTTIDWSFYQTNVSKSAIVADFKKQFDQLKIQFPKDTESDKIEQKKVEMEKEAVRLLEESKQRAEEYKAEVVRINNMKPIEDMTVDEYLADKPDLERQIDWEWENYELVEEREGEKN